MQDSAQLVADGDQFFVPVYGRPPFVLDHGRGAEVWDTDGRRYLDFVAGIAVNALGHADEATVAALLEQAPKLIHTSNLYYTAPAIELGRMLVESCFADKVFFSNSGAEAVEGAFKFARKVGRERGGPEKHVIIAFEGSFHGRTMGAVAATHREKYRLPFMPVMPGVRFAPFNDVGVLEEVIGDDVCAVVVEPIQGEGGITPATDEFLRALRERCDAHGALLIADEVQCGLGRTGELWAHERSGISPDIMVIAKPLGGGLPIGAILVTDAVSAHLHAGDHGSTFAGGPLVCAAASAVFRRISDPSFLEHVRAIGDYLGSRLEELQASDQRVIELRGRGLMRGVRVDGSAADVRDAALDAGLLLVPAGDDIIRLVPPLIIEREHVDEAVSILRHALEALE
ncbi:MAG: Acetylornithine aminotransferase [uncultured Chloroflexia bacterium]|uniref:Acetylornithine aminotransferase n=1 Tax=uncultured Chloroflexia bacterium TaxID=1672391 RepID=A0A6J4HK18_9CHLR|nr:MAG: Acetylornithine aminotransferase [uncultured Chloroflexia bacterium]